MQSARGVVFIKDQILLVYRELDDRKFYTFPGGGMLINESEEDCVKREIFEETGVIVKVIKKVYINERHGHISHYYLCDYVSRSVGNGKGPEFTSKFYKDKGLYKPMLVDIQKIATIPLMPLEITEKLLDDYKRNGRELRNRVKVVKCK